MSCFPQKSASVWSRCQRSALALRSTHFWCLFVNILALFFCRSMVCSFSDDVFWQFWVCFLDTMARPHKVSHERHKMFSGFHSHLQEGLVVRPVSGVHVQGLILLENVNVDSLSVSLSILQISEIRNSVMRLFFILKNVLVELENFYKCVFYGSLSLFTASANHICSEDIDHIDTVLVVLPDHAD